MAAQRRVERRQAIVRVKTGCLTCRRRKKKCDESRPECRGCVRNHLTCQWPQTVLWDATPPYHSSHECGPNASPIGPAGRFTPQFHDWQPDPRSTPTSSDDAFITAEDGGAALSGPSAGSQVLTIQPEEFGYHYDEVSTYSEPENRRTSVARQPDTIEHPLSMFPNSGPHSQDLLQHYLARTAISMGNGSTEVNPFIVQLIPLAFSKDLILQLLLTQSAVHRARLGSNSELTVANSYYAKSLRLFQTSLDNHIQHNGDHALELATGALIMCFVETARGDIDGVVFDHLGAASSLLLKFIDGPDSRVPEGMRKFLVEYYAYTATLAMISVNPTHNTQRILVPSLMAAAHQLLAEDYIGHLCGCWLQLLLLIPRVFDLGIRAYAPPVATEPAFPSSDDFVTFSALQANILSFSPAPDSRPDVKVAGLIYQKAVLLYLYTVLDALPRECSGPGPCENLIRVTLREAMELLAKLSPIARINTSLCWPIAVIGAVISDAVEQTILRDRLQTMFANIGLGNIEATTRLLDQMWLQPKEARNPWTICKTMQEHQLWISFA
ncbi:uncharacterized protein HMPREF1541_00116 [Cyphellophora europaea CBS 101466]|uniref:Zn(2)-C6 fungal-type domain-containing protein n=1 Tax=Cyphellophora europaea (strain CBS 101466) TaxID=1220924 RepID=W2SDH4_CYPE1|nr:uncharacterized protein HMPREF1541_00116 [Cyphellophora europaea CBS 101466]ETN45934.1 hypothetical protein HMPREF1541_00116 [Cyphellophora europaea CBS 101466]